MSNLPPPHATPPQAPADSRPSSRASTESSRSTWASETSDEEDDESELDLMHDGCEDDAYWEEERSADTWLARFQGGTHSLYPQLFVVKLRGGEISTPSRYPNNNFLLKLPSEVRNRIYKHYFDGEVEVKHAGELYAPFRNREGTELQRICLSSDNVELKFWLSTALLQTSRQLRSETIFILFSNRVITVEWLPALPRLVRFLGKEGCAMVRYLDLWDTLNVQEQDNVAYRNILRSIIHFSGLQHLRIVLSCDLNYSRVTDRTYSWFDKNEWRSESNRLPKEGVRPKMRSEELETRWPEYEVLKNLGAQNFTLAMETLWDDGYLEFDKSYGALPGLSQSMRTDYVPMEDAESLETLANPSVSSQQHSETIINLRPCGNIPFVSQDFNDATWQDSDSLTNKAILFYNFFRDFFHNNSPIYHVRGQIPVENFLSFPTAIRSAGNTIQDCAFCYIRRHRCGYHAIPDQPPFVPMRQEGDEQEEHDPNALETRFQDMSYVDMRETCKEMVQWMLDADFSAIRSPDPDVMEFLNVAAVFDYQGWPDMPCSERLARLDAAVEAGWAGKRLDKDEVPPWDVLYREVHSRYSSLYSFIGEADRS